MPIVQTQTNRHDHSAESKLSGNKLIGVEQLPIFFSDFKIKYDDRLSPGQNILNNLHKFPEPKGRFQKILKEIIFVFQGITFEAYSGEEFTFPDNYRLRNCEVIGQGTLLCKSESIEPKYTPQYFGTVTNEAGLKKLLGVYHSDRSIVWNICQAEKAGNWPKNVTIGLRELLLNVGQGKEETLPDNICIHYCTVSEGRLNFNEGTLLVRGKHAIGCAGSSCASVDVTDGIGYTKNGGTGYAFEEGRVISLDGQSYVCANGPKTQAYGMDPDSNIEILNGATGFPLFDSVVVRKDDISEIGTTALNREEPPECLGSGIIFKTDAAVNYRNHILELKELADLGSTEAMIRLYAMDKDNFDALITTGEQQDEYIAKFKHKITGSRAAEMCAELIHNSCSVDEKERSFKAQQKDTDRTFYVAVPGRKGPFDPYTYKEITISGKGLEKAKQLFIIAKNNGAIAREDSFGHFVSRHQKSSCLVS